MALVAAVIAGMAVIAVRPTGDERDGASTPAAVHAPAQSACAKALLLDWSDGRIDRTYPVRCYRSALKSLPSDLEVYSSASDDIAQALSQRIVQGTRAPARGRARRAAG